MSLKDRRHDLEYQECDGTRMHLLDPVALLLCLVLTTLAQMVLPSTPLYDLQRYITTASIQQHFTV